MDAAHPQGGVAPVPGTSLHASKANRLVFVESAWISRCERRRFYPPRSAVEGVAADQERPRYEVAPAPSLAPHRLLPPGQIKIDINVSLRRVCFAEVIQLSIIAASR
jgi:hypothetical protein